MLYNLFENRDFVSVFAVALLAEGVDRNTVAVTLVSKTLSVALLAEGVDRNCTLTVFPHPLRVALLAEGVDRNSTCSSKMLAAMIVALLAEGVDRNHPAWYPAESPAESPSSRRAWIEIVIVPSPVVCLTVALLAEGVDRNSPINSFQCSHRSRPPRGGRG